MAALLHSLPLGTSPRFPFEHTLIIEKALVPSCRCRASLELGGQVLDAPVPIGLSAGSATMISLEVNDGYSW